MTDRLKRKLTTILAADAAEYARHMGEDEAGTYAALNTSRRIFAAAIARHDGRIANTAGDGLIADFASPVEAVTAAVEIQRELANAALRLGFRIGIHLGDVIVDGEDLLGDGVNLAARLQEMAEPGGILLSQQVYDQVRTKVQVALDPMGERRPKHFAEDIQVYGIAPTRKPSRIQSVWPGATGPGPERRGSALLTRDWHREPHLRVFGLIVAAGLVVDLATGPGWFVQWIIVAGFGWLGWHAAGTYAKTPAQFQRYRLIALLALLTLINLITWEGTLWVFWPAAILGGIELLRQRKARHRDQGADH